MASGGKWSWKREEVEKIAQAFSGRYAVRDRAWFVAGVLWAYRISEVLSIKLGEVVEPDGRIKDSITVPSRRLKGGKPRQAQVAPRSLPADHALGCKCKLCDPKEHKRRPPTDRTVPIPPALKPYLQAWMDHLAQTRQGLDPERYLFESRKRATDGTSKPISRQQAHCILKMTMKRAGLANLQLFGTHSLRKTGIQNVKDHTGDIIAARDCAHHRSSATTDADLRSGNRKLFAVVIDLSTSWLPKVA